MTRSHSLALPLRRQDVLRLAVGDTVLLTGEVTVTGGMPAHQRIQQCLQRGESTPVSIADTFLHLPVMLLEGSAGCDVRYANPTTSMRFASYMPQLIRAFDLRIVGGKGGLDSMSVEAMQEVGCVYLSLLGGGSPILSDCIEQVTCVGWDDLPVHFRLSRLKVRDLGPLSVAIDAHGNSIYAQLAAQARTRLPHILERLDARRSKAERGPGGTNN
ncbi:MAG: fumarate hydratase C-terminal domain-containing protein [Pseudomonadota bacterium]|nr:fumarate hydratase C-terminal domain-containing protein [Pseudomonadota bacterium]